MIRPFVLPALLSFAVSAQAEGLNLTDAQRAAFRQEVRDAILADPSPIARALAGPSLYADAVAKDKASLSDQAALFAPTPRGYGANSPRLTIVFFETYPCAECSEAWAEVETLLARHPDIRVEPRFSQDTGAAQLLLSILDREGVESYRSVRHRLIKARTEAELSQLLREGVWVQDRMLRPAPRAEADAFNALDLQSAPALVLPDLMLQGAIPAIVLEKYVAR